MLSEEGLLLVVILVACGLVVLGTLEFVWPTRPRHPQRRPGAVRDPLRRARPRTAPPRLVAAASTQPAIETPAVAAPSEPLASPVLLEVPQFLGATPPVSGLAPAVVAAEPPTVDAPTAAPDLGSVTSATAPAETTRPDRPRPARARPIPRPAPPLVTAAEPPPSQAPVVLPPVAPPRVDPSPRAEPERSVADHGLALVKAGRFSEAATLGQEALAAAKSADVPVPTASATQETARLWGVVGLGKAGLDDLEGARFAFEEAIALASRSERLTWERHLVDVALAVGRKSLVDVDAESGPEHVAALRLAIDWLERGLDVAPDDAELRATLTAARDALWPAHETIVKGLVDRQEFAEARRMLTEVMADPECPPERQGAFRRLLGRTMGGEAARATAEASTYLQGMRVDEAMAALVRAQSLIEAIPPDALARRRRQELERRLWAGYLTLGANRIHAGTPEAALDPLLRAVSFTEIAVERKEEARRLLARTLGEIVETRTVEIVRLVDAGDTSAAATESEKLRSLLRSAVDRGLPEDRLAEVFAKVRALSDRAGAERPSHE